MLTGGTSTITIQPWHGASSRVVEATRNAPFSTIPKSSTLSERHCSMKCGQSKLPLRQESQIRRPDAVPVVITQQHAQASFTQHLPIARTTLSEPKINKPLGFGLATFSQSASGRAAASWCHGALQYHRADDQRDYQQPRDNAGLQREQDRR
jgi:hypothetical protein